MSGFDERKIQCKHTCANCSYGYPVRVFWYYEGERTEERFCMLDASDDDIHYLLGEQPLEADTKYPTKLLEILIMKEDDYLSDSPRMMQSTDCCQFYEGMNKKEESNND